MVCLPDGEKMRIQILVLTQYTNVTDRRTDGHSMTAQAALTIARQKVSGAVLQNVGYACSPYSSPEYDAYANENVNACSAAPRTLLSCLLTTFYVAIKFCICHQKS